MNPSTLFWGVIFGSLGFGYFVYGKKQGVFVPLLSGIGLIVLPYLVANVIVLVCTCVVLAALPWVIKR